jgi:two-component system, chemotaxis family, CheB/CheR fusion protein
LLLHLLDRGSIASHHALGTVTCRWLSTAGASDFIEKPVGRAELLARVERALEQSRDTTTLSAWRRDASERVGTLTSRQRQIMEMVLAGHPSKNIAADHGIRQRTVESHRTSIMKKMGTR